MERLTELAGFAFQVRKLAMEGSPPCFITLQTRKEQRDPTSLHEAVRIVALQLRVLPLVSMPGCMAATVIAVKPPFNPSRLHVARQGDVCCCPAQEADLLAMERTVLNSLGFRVNAPTAYTFWSIFRMSHAAADETSSLALYLTVRPATLFDCRTGWMAGCSAG